MARTVCIIGAGPSGLVAAKCLLHDVPAGSFQVTIFDPQRRVGGLWPVQKDETGGLVHPLMVANQSKHTVQFSDLAWDPKAPEFPRAWQVGRYLERYRGRYCGEAKIHLGCRVEAADQETLAGDDGVPVTRWQVKVRSGKGVSDLYHFDHLIVASGFFGKPLIPDLPLQGPDVPVIHSSSYRDLDSLLGKTNSKGRKILIVGGQMSGIEIAGTIASHLSSATHSPEESVISNPGDYSIHHVIQRPIWVFPLHLSFNPRSATTPFLPLDIFSYNRINRVPPLTDTQGHISPEAARKTNSQYQTVLGTDQSPFSRTVAVTESDHDSPAYLAVSDSYLDFVRSGLITTSHGKLASLTGNTATLGPSNEQVSEIAAVILATGFDASSSLSFFNPSILQTLSLSPTDIKNTVALAFHGTHHPAIPNLGFVGFYRSPYWGVMEMQARFLATLWSSPYPTPSLRAALESDTSLPRTLSLRGDTRTSQFPMGDYAYLMQEFAAALDLSCRPSVAEGETASPLVDFLTPARYPSAHLSQLQEEEVANSLAQTHRTVVDALTRGKFVARAVFRSLLGEWKLERSIVSQLPSHPSGQFSGTAKFLLRDGTADGREGILAARGRRSSEDVDMGLEYLYVEEGDFTADNGMQFRATRRYVWRYDETLDKLSVWFVKTDEQKRADYLFHEIDFQVPEEGMEKEVDDRGWTATAGHLCVEDFYDVKYGFRFEAVNLREWRVGYTVRGPKKDYTIDGSYRR